MIVAALALALAGAQPSGTLVIGIGRHSCAYWLSSPQRVDEGTAWLFGFWSATNAVNTKNPQVGLKSDSEAILAETKKLCTEQPSMTLSNAAAATYFKFQAAGL